MALVLLLVIAAVAPVAVTSAGTAAMVVGSGDISRIGGSSYQLESNYSGPTFFDHFDFFTDDDPTNGYVDYVSYQNASDWGLISATDEAVYIGCDDTTISSGRGRASVRITSKAKFNAGGNGKGTNKGLLFAFDLDHMPTGCGTWPAYWLCGPNWPAGGEIDIIEGVNTMWQDHTTLHTDQGCSMATEPVSLFTGSWSTNREGGPSDDCYVDDPTQWNNAGCGIINTTPGVNTSYGAPFNTRDGGMYVMEWTSAYIQMFYFARGDIPQDLLNGPNSAPDPSSWGAVPYAYFTLNAATCPPQHFTDLQVIINLTFCGDWAGQDFPLSCPDVKSSCVDYTRDTPSGFRDASWSIRSLAIYERN